MTEQELVVVQKVATKEARKLIKKICHLQKKAVSESLIGVIESILSVAVPIASLSNEWELTTLLSSLRVWLEKKKMEQQQEDIARRQIQEQSWSDLGPNYSTW
jgi:hypothetical protein